MAKSIRSKWRRKMRNEKRVVNAKRDLERLKRITAAFSTPQLLDTEMVSVNQPPLYNRPTSDPLGADASEAMETEKASRDPKTLRDEKGHYPAWMNQRGIRKQKAALKGAAKALKAKKKRKR